MTGAAAARRARERRGGPARPGGPGIPAGRGQATRRRGGPAADRDAARRGKSGGMFDGTRGARGRRRASRSRRSVRLDAGPAPRDEDRRGAVHGGSAAHDGDRARRSPRDDRAGVFAARRWPDSAARGG
jgi:hypothetical protein